MTRTAPALVLAACSALVANAHAEDGSVGDRDRFALWNNCDKISLVVEGTSKDAEEIDLTRDRIERTVRSRLGSARIYSASHVHPSLYIRVGVVGRAFSTEVSFIKFLADPVSASAGAATTWDSGGVGTHGNDAGFIISGLAEHIDTFIDEYLRINENACGPS